MRDILERYAPCRPVAGVPELACHQTSDLYGLWEAYEARYPAAVPSEPPFWALAWPAARLAARWLLDHPERVRGKSVLEIACGGGLAAIAAAKSGARVTGNDVCREALLVTSENAAANGVEISLVQADAVDLLEETGSWDIVLAADFFYDRRSAEGVAQRLRDLHRAGTEVWIADGGRAFVPRHNVRCLSREPLKVDTDIEGVDTRQVQLLELVHEHR